MVTHHGPILYYDPLKSDQKEEEQIKLSYWSNSIEPSKPNRNMFSAIRGLTKSKNVHESRQSLKDVESVSVNLVLADVEGNIAHQITGKFPVKTENHQKHPIFPGWLPEFDFQKYIPFEEFPHYINPECGYLVSSNNMHKGEWPFFGKNYLLPTRYERITEIIEEMIKTNTENNTKINSKDFFGIIWDVKSMSGDRFVNILEKKFDGFLSSHENKQIPIMWQKLKSWDRMMEKDSVGASLYETLRVQLIRSIILSKLDQNLKILFSGKTFNSIIKDHSAWTFSHYQILNDLLENHENSWWIKEQKNDIETILGNGFVETLQFWEKKKGLTISQIDQWTYGKIHKFELQHMFSQVIEAAKMAFNSEAVEYGGNSETVCLQSSCETWLAQSYMCSSMRAFFDLNDPKNTEYILSSGNSSNSASEFNLNHFNITLQKSSATAYWEKVDYLKNEKHHLQLIPKNKTKIETKKEK